MPASGISTQLAVLLFLGAMVLLWVLLFGLVWAQVKQRHVLRRRLLIGLAGGCGLYLALLFGAGLASRPETIVAGSEKYFCELDCHLAYAVAAVHSLSRAAASPEDRVWAVDVRARFDPATISPRRDRSAPTWPAPRKASVIDSTGRLYPALWTVSDTMGLTQPLRPGETTTATLLFALPAGVRPTGLVLTDGLMVSHFLIGHERSPFHAPVVLALPQAG